MSYALSGTDAAAFSINSATGVVTINATPDFETKASYSFNVKASDASGDFNIQAVTINVTDLPPVISSGNTASVVEGVPASTTVYTAAAADPAGGTVSYALSGTDARTAASASTARPAWSRWPMRPQDRFREQGGSYSFCVQGQRWQWRVSIARPVAIAMWPTWRRWSPVDSQCHRQHRGRRRAGNGHGLCGGVTASSSDVNGPAVTYSLIGDTDAGGGFTIDSRHRRGDRCGRQQDLDFESAASHTYTIVKASDAKGGGTLDQQPGRSPSR